VRSSEKSIAVEKIFQEVDINSDVRKILAQLKMQEVVRFVCDRLQILE